ncbi:MAG: AAA family ATPase [Deltaproteobacteria bacterium]|jgi:ATP-dependent Clp protease ATP-binding subunit ClpB|nr:AAA family ATPase [Deltaproteobacteria bacterium]MBW2529966.1 AAA family ATPase [Deltaproteobacteria bacterium]
MSKERDGVIRLEKYSTEAKQLVAGAQQLADERQHDEVAPLHLLALGVDRSAGIAAVLKSAGAPPEEVGELCDKALERMAKSGKGMAYVSPALLDLLERAEREAGRDRSDTVEVAHLLHALAQEIRGPAGEILSSFSIGPGGFRDHLGALDQAPKGLRGVRPVAAAAGGDGYTHDLVADARADRFDPVIGRDVEVRRLLQILERRFKNHPLIIGDAGVGKTTIIRGLAQRLAKGDVPSNLADARLVELSTGALMAGAKLRGEVEQRLKGVLDGLKSSDSTESILVVEELHTLFGQGITGAGVGDLLKPELTRGDLRILATTTGEGLPKINERDPAVVRRFSAFTIEPPSIEQAQEMLRGISSRYEAHHRVRITEGAIRTAVTLARRYVPDRSLPDSAVDLLDETASRKRVEVDGVPEQVDAAIRRLESIKAQLAGLRDDDDKLSVQTREQLEKEAAALEPKVAEMREEIESRRGVIAAVRSIRKELTQAQQSRSDAEQGKDFAKLGELEHVVIPEIERRLETAEQAAARAGIDEEKAVLTDGDVARTVNDWTGIPVAKMLEGEAEKLLVMEERLGQRVVGQDEAVTALSKAVRRGRVGLRDPGKPIGSFMFLGPSGVGKTELAKALAEFLFDDEQAMTRLDMSEFMERHMAQRLIGAPPGYADSEAGGHLTEAVRRKPYSVLLFDEVEKAHADVFNLLLQVLDDGRLTDGRGRVADFSNAVVIMTSNIGSQRILDTDINVFETEDGREALEDVLKENLSDFFRPEFLNRLDDIIVFKPLTKTDLLAIVDIQLRRLKQLLADREIEVTLSDAAKKRLVDMGYEPALGARPLKRAILKELQNPLAEAILRGGDLSSGKMSVDLDGDRFEFTKS